MQHICALREATGADAKHAQSSRLTERLFSSNAKAYVASVAHMCILQKVRLFATHASTMTQNKCIYAASADASKGVKRLTHAQQEQRLTSATFAPLSETSSSALCAMSIDRPLSSNIAVRTYRHDTCVVATVAIPVQYVERTTRTHHRCNGTHPYAVDVTRSNKSLNVWYAATN